MNGGGEKDGRRQIPWSHRGRVRPEIAEPPGLPGQESVWDYPRPPAVIPDSRAIEIRAGEVWIARSRHSIRVLETASPPTFYLPRNDVDMDLLRSTEGRSLCEWKGTAGYFDLKLADKLVKQIAWCYEHPYPEFAMIAGCLSFYPGRVDCFVDGEPVRAQSGGYYGGWVTDEIVGPFKGEPGTYAW